MLVFFFCFYLPCLLFVFSFVICSITNKHFLHNRLHRLYASFCHPIWLRVCQEWHAVFKLSLVHKLLKQAGDVVGPIIDDNPFGYSFSSKYLFGHIDTFLTGELSVYIQMSIWSSSQPLVGSSGHKSERESETTICHGLWEWFSILFFLMPLANTALLNSFSNVVDDARPKHSFLLSICICLSLGDHSTFFCIISNYRSFGIIIQSSLMRIPFSIVSSLR